MFKMRDILGETLSNMTGVLIRRDEDSDTMGRKVM